MCQCDSKTCPKCDPNIEAFYQEKVKLEENVSVPDEAYDLKDSWTK
jgi:hypothetical protein